jgi:hypothetical protein
MDVRDLIDSVQASTQADLQVRLYDKRTWYVGGT